MAKNTGRSTRTTGESQARPHPDSNGSGSGLWKRNLVTGRFTDSKKTGGAFRNRRTG